MAAARWVSGGLLVGGVIAGILLVRVLETAQAELTARVLPCLPLTVPMKTKLRQLLPRLGGGLLGERHPHPLADDFRDAEQVRRCGLQHLQNLLGRECAVLL